MSMIIPKTTKECPYIEFRWDLTGNLTLSITSVWWGGINSGFSSSDGSFGNTCKRKSDLPKYIEQFKRNKIKQIDMEIESLHERRRRIISKISTLKGL